MNKTLKSTVIGLIVTVMVAAAVTGITDNNIAGKVCARGIGMPAEERVISWGTVCKAGVTMSLVY